MIKKHVLRGAWLALVPLAAAARGIGFSLVRRQPQWVPYYVCFAVFNYLGITRELAPSLRPAGNALS